MKPMSTDRFSETRMISARVLPSGQKQSRPAVLSGLNSRFMAPVTVVRCSSLTMTVLSSVEKVFSITCAA